MVKQTLVKTMLPSMSENGNYTSALFSMEDEIRKLFIMYGLFPDTKDLELAICTVYTVAEVLQDKIFTEDVNVVIIEEENAKIPLKAIAVAAILKIPVDCIGPNLVMPKIKNDLFDQCNPLITILKERLSVAWLNLRNDYTVIISYDDPGARCGWFRIHTSGNKWLVSIVTTAIKSIRNVRCSAYRAWFDKRFTFEMYKYTQVWYEDKLLEEERRQPIED